MPPCCATAPALPRRRAMPNVHQPNARAIRARSVVTSRAGKTITQRCAMKLRLPNVPPGARFRLNEIDAQRRTSAAAPCAAPITPASASAATSRARRPARASARAHQKHVAPRERQRDGAAGQPPVRREQRREHAEHEERGEQLVDAAESRALRARLRQRARRAAATSRCSTSSFGTKKRSSSNCL